MVYDFSEKKNVCKLNQIFFLEYVPFKHKNDVKYVAFFTIPLVIFLFLLSGCGGNGCRTAEQTINGGEWESSQFTKVKPLNPAVIKQESQFGSYVLHDGVTEAMAKENLWYELKTQASNDVIVTSGNKFTMDVSGSVILAGSSQILNVRLSDYMKLNNKVMSGSNVEEETRTITPRKPIKMTKITRYLPDGSYEYEYEYEVKDDDGTSVTLNSSQSDTRALPECSSKTAAKEKINYIWYFPKKIIFHKWIDENYNLVDKTVVVDVDENGLSCKVSSANGVLWYVCTFNYNGSNLQYKRRVTPVIVANYPQFEEQVSKTDEEIQEFLSQKSRASDSSRSSGMDSCYKDGERPDEDCINRIIDQADREAENAIKLTDEEYKQNYYMCIVGGKAINNTNMCGQYKFGVVGTEDDRITPKSPIMVVFKTHDEIYGSRAKKNYDNQKCFQQGDYKNRFLPISSAYSKTSCEDDSRHQQELAYQQFCRMAPKEVKYNLHKIKRNGYDWLDHDASFDEIKYCTTDCPRKDGYDLQKTVGECPNDCAVQLYRDDGVSIDEVIEDPIVVSRVDYQHRRRKEVDLRAGSRYDDADNTLYYAIDKNIIDKGEINVVRPNKMNWSQARIPCIEATSLLDTAGYRRLSIGYNDCCRDYTNRTKTKNSRGESGYFMCDDVAFGTNCRTSLITSTICNENMIAQGNCYHVFSSNYLLFDNNHVFCDGYENDPVVTNIELIKASTFDITKPAYLVNADAIREYIGGSVEIPNIYPYDPYDSIGIHKNVGLEYGLMPVASDDVTLIECVDDIFPNLQVFEESVIYIEKPEGYDDMEENIKEKFNIIPDTCKVEGTYITYRSNNEISFNKGDAGIIPMQWSAFPVRAGQTVPITIASRYPVLIKSGNQYIEMHNGNGLMVYLDPNEDDDNSDNLSDPDLWQCNMGVGGSYAYYRPYKYADLAVKSERNPRKINTPNEMWWFCDDERPMWFSGYDFKNIKTGKPVYMHTYDVDSVKKFLPLYEEGGTPPSHDDLPVDEVGCNEDGLPSSMVIDGKLYEHANITGLLYDTSLGPQYVYSDGVTQKTIPVSDSSITSKTYERFAPKIIVVDLTDEGLTNVQIQADTDSKTYNSLKRTYKKDNNGKILQAYYEFKYFSKDYKIRVEDSIIHKPSICYNEGEFAPTDTLSDDEATKLTDIEFTNDSKYYVLNKTDNLGEVFTRFGPFSGMHVNTSGMLLPAIYTTEGACLEHFIYDEQHEKSPEGNKYMSTFYGIEATRILRKNLSKSWRMEFTTPALEYNNGDYLIEEMPDNSTGTLSRCYNKYNFEGCSADSDNIPDIVLVDLSKTSNAKKKPVSGSVVLYKDENFLKYKEKYYYPVTFAPLGWNEYLLDKDDPMVSSIKCSGYSNCGEGETPIIELTANSVFYRIEDGDNVDGVPVRIGKLQKRSALSFDIIIPGDNYSAGNYTIDNPVLDKNAICFTANKVCKSYLDRYVSVDTISDASETCSLSGKSESVSGNNTEKVCKVKNEYLYSLSRSPYVVACQNDKVLGDDTTSVYSTPYSKGKVYPNIKSNDGGYVLKTNIYDFVTNQYFARCVPSWITPGWMIMDQPNDPSTFGKGYTAVSGTYIAPDGKSWSVNDVKDKYHLESAWKSYGGIVKNSVMNQNCSLKTLSGGATYKSNCSLKNVNTFDASFVARYPQQLIMVKPIVNDPINTSDDECKISVTGGKNASAKIKMNSPFAFSSSMINGYALDRKESEKNIAGVQHCETVNGDGKHGMEFFKQSEFQRNMIGAGILTPYWTTLESSDGSSAIFKQGEQINFSTSGNYYASGALSHEAQGYCMIHGSARAIGAIAEFALALAAEAMSGTALFLAATDLKAAKAALAVGGWPVAGPLFASAAGLFATALVFQGEAIAAMVAGALIAEAPNGKMKVERPEESKRSCGVATAFRVVPLPPAACLKGYVAKCNNSRINDYVGQDASINEKILSYCKSEENVDFRTQRMKVGACNKQMKSINDKTVLETRPQRYKNSDMRYINTLTDAVGKWSDLENVYEENCGVCVKRNSINSYNGITYSIDELSVFPKTVRTSSHCENYIDDDGNTYAWLKNVKLIKPFDKYTFANRNVVLTQISNIISNKISECDAESTYSMSVDDEITLNNIKTAFLKAQTRNLENCISNMMSVYSRGISLSDTTNECKDQVSDALENMSTAACNEMLAISKNIDGDEYYNYIFSQNATSASCQDDKYNRTVGTNDNKFGSITRVGAEDVLSEYGYGELTTDNSSTTADGTTNITLHIPTTLKGKNFKTAKLGFFFAGEDNVDPLRLYKNYRIINEDDLQRGYTLTVGSGSQITKGKYLYYYIQPLNDQGRPDPSYDPNVLFSPSSSNYTPETIANSNLVYSFKAYDKNDTGKISVVSPRTGKLWLTTLDSEKLSPGDGDADGKYIEFADTSNEDGTAIVSGNNVLYTHGGYYTAHVNVQTDQDDSIDGIVSGDNVSGVNKLLTSLVIKPIRTIFVGDYVCKRCLISNMSKCEKKTDDNIDDKDWYIAGYKKVCDYDWQEGLLGKIALSFLRTHLLYVIWIAVVLFSVFVIGFQFITGEQKLDFAFMKKYLWRYALIMAFVNPQSLELYVRLFVKPAFSLADGLSAFVAGNFSSEKYTAMEPQNFFYSAFGPIDKILKFWINKYTFEKLLAILFSSWTGIIVVVILIMCFIFFMLSVIQAVILYVVILIKMSLYLSIGPVVFLLLVHEKTASKFTDWWKTIAGCIAEQVMTFAGLSFFGTIYYHIIKGSMNFVYCWEPIIKIPVLDITLFSMWRISGTMPAHMAELSGTVGDEIALNTKGFNFLTAFILFIITCMMSEFVDKASAFGAKLFGQESSMPAEVKQILGQVRSAVKGLPMKGFGAVKDIVSSKKKKSGDDKTEREGAENK